MYADLIKKVANCNDAESVEIEDIMRDVIFQSTLDWQTRQELIEAVKLAQELLAKSVLEFSARGAACL